MSWKVTAQKGSNCSWNEGKNQDLNLNLSPSCDLKGAKAAENLSEGNKQSAALTRGSGALWETVRAV